MIQPQIDEILEAMQTGGSITIKGMTVSRVNSFKDTQGNFGPAFGTIYLAQTELGPIVLNQLDNDWVTIVKGFMV